MRRRALFSRAKSVSTVIKNQARHRLDVRSIDSPRKFPQNPSSRPSALRGKARILADGAAAKPKTAIFVFLPERLVMPVGRVVLGVATIGVGIFIATKFL
ncbi:MAG TPA: hypothetical protein VKP30_07305 [Polyangiaceae bacterium]|nr:hypothetical protein [Polyangiaceae bacterium]